MFQILFEGEKLSWIIKPKTLLCSNIIIVKMPDKRAKAATDTDQEPSKKQRKEESNPLAFDPVHFIRSHSKNNDPADIQTQIWDVVFEPDPNDRDKTTSKVATCGGNSICIIDVVNGTVLMKYKHKELK